MLPFQYEIALLEIRTKHYALCGRESNFSFILDFVLTSGIYCLEELSSKVGNSIYILLIDSYLLIFKSGR